MRKCHDGGFRSARESVLSASLDRTARLWNARTGEALGEPMRHQGAVRSADYSADGRRIVTASEDARPACGTRARAR
jgi:WD40 repeat protein